MTDAPVTQLSLTDVLSAHRAAPAPAAAPAPSATERPNRGFQHPVRTPSNGASQDQKALLRDMIAERASNPAVQEVRDRLNEWGPGNLTRAGFSWAFDALKAIPRDAGSAPAKVKVNKYAGKCEECGKQVAAEAGRLSKDDEGKWQVWHLDGECPQTEFPFPYGGYALDGTGEVKFYVANEEGFFAKASNELWPMPANDNTKAVIEAIAADPKAASARYGQELNVCGRCGRDLTSEWRKVGIGPVCSQKAW